MPITLPPMNRRRFLTTTLGTLLLSPAVWAQDTATDSDTWAFLSDTHLPGDREKSGGKPPIKPVETFSKVRSDILSGQCGRPGGVLVTGDCVYLHGKPEDYRTLLGEFAPLRKADLPVHFLMGNHDNRQAFLEEVAKEIGETPPQSIPPRLCSIVETSKANFFLMDSLEKTNYTPGLFGEAQLDWLTTELDKRPDKPAVLFAHHYPDYSAAVVKNPHALMDTEAFFERIKDRRQVKAYIFGHAHVWKILQKHGIHLINLPTTAWRFDATQPCGWVLATFRDNGVNLTLRSIEPEHRKHNELVELAWRPD